MSNPSPRFTGLFIPSEILEMDLTSTECMLLAWIDALYCKDHGGCYASNEYFCKKLHLKENTVKILISKLVEMGLVERVSFDGRQRVIRACKERWFLEKSQSTSDVDFNQPQTLNKINPCGLKESTSHNIYIEKSREKINTQGTPKAPVCLLSSFGKHIKLKQEDYDQFCKEHGKEAIDSLIIEMDDWISAKGKPYKDYSAAIRTWLRKEKITQPRASKGPTIEDNKKHAKEISKIYQSTFYKIEALTKQVEFTPLGANGQTYVIKYEENGFKDQMENFLRKLEFRKKEKKE